MLSRTYMMIFAMATLRVARAFARRVPARSIAIPSRPAVGTSFASNEHDAASSSKNERRTVHKAVRDSLAETSKTGEFVRRESAWRNWISQDKDAMFSPEADRYHLFVAMACPWAHRALITRSLKGLEDVISVTVVHPVWQKTRPEEDSHRGWVFSNPDGEMLTNSEGRGSFAPAYEGNEVEPFFGSKSVRDLYDEAGDTEGKYTVPILWDKASNTIVSNESAEIIRMLNSEFNEFSKKPDLDLYPAELQETIDAVNEWIYPNLNNGVYRCGFAKTQEAYDQAIGELTTAFDKADDILQKQRYVAGDQFSEADIRLFVTLLRFDEVYVVYFKTNTRSVATTPAILNYCREIYQMPGVKETVNMEQIKTHYFCSHAELNYFSILPKGSNFVKLLKEPHNRDLI